MFNFPRLSVDIDLDLTKNLAKDEMIKEKENIHNLLVNYLNSNNYKINMEKSKNVYALDSIVAEYIDIKGNIDNIKDFYDKFQKGVYEPELLFDDKKIIERIKEHPMIIWKLNNK